MDKIDEQRRVLVEEYHDMIPELYTLSNAACKFVYWDWLYSAHHSVGKELGYESSYSEYHESAYDRGRYLEKLLTITEPVTRTETIEVCHRFVESGKGESMEDNGAVVVLSLVGEYEGRNWRRH